jgi:hypothetical protein
MAQFIYGKEDAKYVENLSLKAKCLVSQQKAAWNLAGENYRLLDKVRTRTFHSDDLTMICQFNPGRIRSSAANTSAGAILARPCFLCKANRPPEQREIPFGEELVILTNPFPIFPYHLTIPSVNHVPQRISGNLGIMADLSRALEGFTVLYNGPSCGASAPDHFHFQAGIRGVMPLEDDLRKMPVNRLLTLKDGKILRIGAFKSDFRRFVLVRSSEKAPLTETLEYLIGILGENGGEEPMVNILMWYETVSWNVVFFPRAKQRPFQYYAEGDKKLLVSPAAVELGGLIILPREEDFVRITPGDLESIFDQVSLSDQNFELLVRSIGEL